MLEIERCGIRVHNPCCAGPFHDVQVDPDNQNAGIGQDNRGFESHTQPALLEHLDDLDLVWASQGLGRFRPLREEVNAPDLHWGAIWP